MCSYLCVYTLKREREEITGRVLALRPTLMKTEAKEDNKTPHPISRKPD